MQVLNSTSSDIDFIFELFDAAIDYQKRKNYELWPRFGHEMINARSGNMVLKSNGT